MKIGLDLDEVVYNFLAQFKKFLRGEGYALPDTDGWIGYEELGIDKKDESDLLERAIMHGVFREGDAIDGAIEGIRMLRHLGHSIHIVTHREHYRNASQVAYDTVIWLRGAGIQYDTITFAKDKTIVDVDVLVEDNLDNFWAVVAKKRMAILFDQPWNQDPTVLARAYWWGDVVQMIREMP